MNYRNIVILTGSGISAESGLKTFRANDGLWEGHRVEDVATSEGFARSPALVQQFYNERRAQLKTVAPNAAHTALAKLEREFPGNVLLVTQNVDDLHERAGSRNLIHMHGELKKARHLDTHEIIDCDHDLSPEGAYRPHIVWFGEMPFEMERITRSLKACDLFLSIGTSGLVYPAAGFVQEVRFHGMAETIELNLEPSAGNSLFERSILGPASRTVPELVAEILGA